MLNLNEFPVAIGIISGIGILAKTIHHFSKSKFDKQVKKYEIFKEIKILLEEDELLNLPIISMTVQCISKRELTLAEVK